MTADFEQVTVSIRSFFDVVVLYLHNLYVNVAIVCMFFFWFLWYGVQPHNRPAFF